MKKIYLIIAVISLFSMNIADAQQTTVKEKSKLLDTGITEFQVKMLIGNPESVEVTTCGGNKPWSCKIYTYKDSCCGHIPPELTIYFQKVSDKWYVNSWNIYGK